MTWRKVEPMEERYKFVMLAKEEGANISSLCKDFGISRKTGYQVLERYSQEGLAGLQPRSRRPHSCPNSVSSEMICEIVSIRNAHPTWGGMTLREILLRTYSRKEVPCARTIDRVLKRCGLVQSRRRKKKRKYIPETIVVPKGPNDVWTVDFKGWWRTKDGLRCVPLTIRDEYSKYIIDIGALVRGSTGAVRHRFEGCFKRYGLPKHIRSDNGSPFSAYLGLCGLSKLSVWWIKNGIMPNRIPPGSPQYNGGHERMHRDMKAELQKNPAKNIKVQQRTFDQWKKEFNQIRPHRGLNMATPADYYQASSRSYLRNPKEYEYGQGVHRRKVGSRGQIWWKGTERFLSNSLASEYIGVEEENRNTISLWYCNFYLGSTDSRFKHPLRGA